MKCIVVTPEKTVVDQEATFVALPLFDGELGIAPAHSPMLGRMGVGELRITTPEGSDSVSYYVEGGFVEVLGDVISVLTSRAIPSDQLDAFTARDQLLAARERPATSPELMTIRDRAVTQARAQVRLASRKS